MRKCKGYYQENGQDIEFYLGYFHQFVSNDYFPLAIVELPDGRVVKVRIENLEFLDKHIGKFDYNSFISISEADYKELLEYKYMYEDLM